MAFTPSAFFLLCGIAGLMTGAWSLPTDGCCPEGWTQLDDHCYVFQDDLRTFADAESVCNVLGGNLVSITSYVDNLVVVALAKEGGVAFTWIGLHDAIEKGDFLWTDGTDFEFDNFAENQPDFDGACVELSVADGTFFDKDCTFEQSSVCIRDTFFCDSH
ncbi:lithostathine-1-like isoform X2 [Nerophis ophidion]|uniref:lithostathine-1-like isoform X2 n=1 Tax=Nerophis ophidion TaxID=159077 RepID=UPI002AE03506|nr:lithostathine-1-like isoform X2 [Nerophis ophidion]XP_061758504.1 lithostathine-1-like isoform X2 [Nerophis ophidion]